MAESLKFVFGIGFGVMTLYLVIQLVLFKWGQRK